MILTILFMEKRSNASGSRVASSRILRAVDWLDKRSFPHGRISGSITGYRLPKADGLRKALF